MDRGTTYKVIAWFGRRLFVSSVVNGRSQCTKQQSRQNSKGDGHVDDGGEVIGVAEWNRVTQFAG
jgi:hypothetical protein